MFEYKIKIGLVPMRRNTTDRPRGASWNWYSPEQRCKEVVSYIEEKFTSSNVEFVDTKGLGIGDLIFDGKSAKQAIERMKEFQSDGQSRSFVDLLLGKPDGYASTIIDGIKSQLAIDAAKLSSQLGRKVEIEEIYK